MRTRRPLTAEKSSLFSATCASIAARTASGAVRKAAQYASPIFLKTNPPLDLKAASIISSCRVSAGFMATRYWSQRSVEPSMSVNKNVTVPDGMSADDGLTARRSAVWSDTHRLLNRLIFSQRRALLRERLQLGVLERPLQEQLELVIFLLFCILDAPSTDFVLLTTVSKK